MLRGGARELPDQVSCLADEVRLESLPVAPERQMNAPRPARVGIVAIGVEDGVLHRGLGLGADMAAFGEDDGQADAEMERGLDHGMGRCADGPDERLGVRQTSRPFEVGEAQGALRSSVTACCPPLSAPARS